MKIGIIGGGQLARMILEGCYKFGFEFYILSKEMNSPAGQITSHEIQGDWNDKDCLQNFSRQCDVITLENEFINYKLIKFLEDNNNYVYPGSGVIRLVQDKLYQKQTLEKINIPVAKFSEVNSKDDIILFAEKNNYPVIIKSRTMGYDGKGNIEIKSENDIDNAFDKLSKRGKLMCESFVRFDKEIATQVVRSKSGEIKIYPVVETIQKNHICHLVAASGNLFGDIKEEVETIARNIVTNLKYVGVMGIEMFLTGGKILVNELAPRVHNSGHYTIEGCHTSQFENHIRAILDMPLGRAELKEPCSVMINILGDRNGRADLKGLRDVLKEDNSYVHIYGKKETRTGRKMGHITVTGDDLNSIITKANQYRDRIFL